MTQITRPSFTPGFAEWFNDSATTLEDLFDAYYDSYKECHGIKPRWMTGWNNKEEAADDYESLAQDWKHEDERQKNEDATAIDRFEETIQSFIKAGANDRETALRWMTSACAFDSKFDVEHYVYEMGLLFLPQGKELLDQLVAMYLEEVDA